MLPHTKGPSRPSADRRSGTTITWSHPPLLIEALCTLLARLAFYLLPSFLFLAYDLLFPSLSKPLKSHGALALPISALNTSTRARLARYVGLATFNTLLSIVLQLAIELLFTSTPLPARSALRITSTLPAPWSLAKDLTRALIIRGTLSYLIHRYLLHPKQSTILAQLHGSYAHSLRHTLPLASSYDHPLPYLLHRFLPTYAPALLFRFHILTYLVYLSFVSLEEAFSFSGYSVLPSTILLSGMARRQEAHYLCKGKGNFGVFGVMDWCCSTVVGEDDVVDDVVEEAGKRDVGGKVKRGAKRLEATSGGQEEGKDVEEKETGKKKAGGKARRGERKTQAAADSDHEDENESENEPEPAPEEKGQGAREQNGEHDGEQEESSSGNWMKEVNANANAPLGKGKRGRSRKAKK